MKQQIIRSSLIEKDLAQILNELDYDGLFLLTDENTHKLCFPLIEKLPEIRSARKCCIASGDRHKNLETLSSVWKFLTENGANRKSLMINLGGGMVTDLGGFAAATFKRGIRFINIPTTLLGAVDAAVGGKTGINFNGLKNEIGAFAPAIAVLIHSYFFKTLDHANLLSGYAEMLKHALLMPPSTETPSIVSLLQYDLENPDYQKLNDLLFESVVVKERIVEEDPTEQGIRKALNLGHTFGHAFESLSYELNRPVLHGYAVAWGIVCELYLSFIQLGFDRNILLKIAYFIKENYDAFAFDCKQYSRLYELMQHDKKNESVHINFTLLRAAGEIEINQTAGLEKINETLDFYCDFFR
jgi:3-dehydroquinate synthase